MKTLLSLLFVGFTIVVGAQSAKYSRVKIYTDAEGLGKLAQLGVTVDHGESKKDIYFMSDFSAEEIVIMKNNGFTYEIIIDDVQKYYVEQNKKGTDNLKNVGCSTAANNELTPNVPVNFNLGTMGGFLTYAQYLAEIDEMVALYPNLISPKATISTFTTFENRPIYWMRLSDNPNADEAEPEVLYSALHHAREPMSLGATVFYMWYLLENYATNLEVKYLVDNTEMYFVPVVNPDGYVYNGTTNPTGGGMWRKNRRNNGDGTYGVDLNRNYSYGWNTTGVSPTTSGDTWPGTAAFSEPETQAMRWFCNNRNFEFAFNAHTFDASILYPIGTTEAEFAVDDSYFNLFTSHMVEYNGYVNMKSSGLYPASGDSDDYMYKEDLANKPKIFAMTPEISDDGFWPATTEINGIGQEMVFSNKILAHLAHKYLDVKETDPLTIVSTSGNFNHVATRLGLEDGVVTVSIAPLINIQSVGAPIAYNIALEQVVNSTISYVLDPAITLGSIVKYVLITDNGSWVRRDTIVKNYGQPTVQITENGESITNWTGTWVTTNATFYSPSKCITESPAGNYANNATKTITYNPVIDLSSASNAKVTFYTKFDIENNFDFVQFQVSTDNGTSWNGQCGLFTNSGVSGNGSIQPAGQPVYDGAQAAWVQEEISLSQYLGQTIKVRFLFKSDGGATADGFFFDDFKVYFNSNVSLEEVTLIKTHPNPANDEVTIATNQAVKEGVMTITDMNGKIVKTHVITGEVNQVTFNVKDLPQGVYTINLIADRFYAKSQRLVVIH
jgi:carboxypeptidase T